MGSNVVRGWRRIGYVLSAMWFVGCFGFVWLSTAQQNDQFAQSMISLCTATGKSFDACWAEDAHLFFKPSWALAQAAAGLAFIPIPLAGFVAWIGVRIVRWVRMGFAPNT